MGDDVAACRSPPDEKDAFRKNEKASGDYIGFLVMSMTIASRWCDGVLGFKHGHGVGTCLGGSV
jgi:hypothetical protein